MGDAVVNSIGIGPLNGPQRDRGAGSGSGGVELSDDIPTGVYHSQIATAGTSLEASRSDHQHQLAETAQGDAADIWYVSLAPAATIRAAGDAQPVGSYIYTWMGGTGGTTNNTSVERYDPVLDTWSTMLVGQTGTGRHGAGFGINGVLYFYGGATDGGGSGSSNSRQYDVATNVTGAPAQNLPSVGNGMCSAVSSVGLGYIGVGSNNNGGLNFSNSGVFRQFDAVTETFQTKATHPDSGAYFANLSRLNDTDLLHRTHGYGPTSGTTRSDDHFYSIASNAWTIGTVPPPNNGAGGFAERYGNAERIYTGGSTNSLFEFDEVLLTYTALAARDFGAYHAQTCVTGDGVWQFGGDVSMGTMNRVTPQFLTRRYL